MAPTDGRLTSQPLFTGSLTGSEFVMLVSPGSAATGVNYKMLSSTLASFILPNGATALPLVGNGTAIAPTFQLLTVPGGGSGTASLGTGVLIGQGTAAVIASNTAATGQVLAANNGTPSFTGAPQINTSVTVPLIAGGVGSTSTLIIESTSGTGTSDAIIFETGSQTQAMRVTSGGQVEIGPQTIGYANALLDVNYTPNTAPNPPQGGIQQIRITSHSAAGFVSETFNNSGAIFPVQYFRAAQGTSGTPLAVGASRVIGAQFFQAYNGASYNAPAQIVVNTINAQTATDSSGNLQIEVTPSGTTTQITAVTVQGSGGVSIGNITDPGAGKLLVSANATAITTDGSNSTSNIHVVGADGGNTRLGLTALGNNPQVLLYRANGTGGGQTALNAADTAAAFGGGGYNGASYISGGVLQILAAENWNATSAGSLFRFLTTPTGSTTVVEVVRIQASGGVSIGTTTDPGTGSIEATGDEILRSGTGLSSTGTAVLLFSSVANFGIFMGTGVPTGNVVAGTGSLLFRNDGNSATTRMYINQNGGSTWTGITTQA